MRGVFAKLNSKSEDSLAIKAVAVADTEYQNTLIKLVADSKMRLEALKRRTSNETLASPLPSPLQAIEEENEQPSLPQIKKRAPRSTPK